MKRALNILIGVAILATYGYMVESYVTPNEYGQAPVWEELATLIVWAIASVLIYTGVRKK